MAPLSLSLCQNCPVHVGPCLGLFLLLSALAPIPYSWIRAVVAPKGIPCLGAGLLGCRGGDSAWQLPGQLLPSSLQKQHCSPITPAALLQWRERGGRVPGGCQEDLPEHPRRKPGPERGRVGRTAQTVSPAGRAANERTPAPERRLWLLVTPPWLLLTPHLWL